MNTELIIKLKDGKDAFNLYSHVPILVFSLVLKHTEKNRLTQCKKIILAGFAVNTKKVKYVYLNQRLKRIVKNREVRTVMKFWN